MKIAMVSGADNNLSPIGLHNQELAKVSSKLKKKINL